MLMLSKSITSPPFAFAPRPQRSRFMHTCRFRCVLIFMISENMGVLVLIHMQSSCGRLLQQRRVVVSLQQSRVVGCYMYVEIAAACVS